MKFRVLNGQHKENNKTYVKGDVIESSLELDKIFTRRFERLDTPSTPEKGTPDLPDVEDKGDVPTTSPNSSASKDKTKREEQDSSNEDFDQADGDPAGQKDEAGEGPSSEPEPPSEVDYGKDVTSKFPTADDLGVKVYHKDKKFMVVDPDLNEPMNKKPMTLNQTKKLLKELEG